MAVYKSRTMDEVEKGQLLPVDEDDVQTPTWKNVGSSIYYKVYPSYTQFQCLKLTWTPQDYDSPCISCTRLAAWHF
jgi:hypothetical protein